MLDFSEETINKSELESLWEKNTRPTVLYLHNPFCKQKFNCSYCMHKGCPASEHDIGEVADFYFNYMNKLMDFYAPIINSQEIVLLNFGGGTPNYLDAKDFETYLGSLFYKFPQLLGVPKVIELHPALITKEFIKLLKGFNFTTLIFCFQTFENEILRANGRLIPDHKVAFKCMEYAKQLDMNIAVDLITYWDTRNGWEIELRNDLEVLKDLDIDEITISVLYQNKYNNPDFEGGRVYRNIKWAVNKVFPDWENPEGTLDNDYNVAATRIYRPESKIKEDFDIYINSLSDMPWQHEQGYSTLGLGTYKNGDKAAYSIIGQEYLIYEEFVGFDKDPILHIHKRWNFWDAARNVIDYLENHLGENPPVGSSLVLNNICKATNLEEEQFNQVFPGNCEWAFLNRICYSGKSTNELIRERAFTQKIEHIDKKEVNNYNIQKKGEKNE